MHPTRRDSYSRSLSSFEPGLVEALEKDHREIERLGSVLEATMEEIEALQGEDDRIAGGDGLCRDFNSYLAFFIKHLNYEEAEAIGACQ
jgi:hypothetical protein